MKGMVIGGDWDEDGMEIILMPAPQNKAELVLVRDEDDERMRAAGRGDSVKRSVDE